MKKYVCTVCGYIAEGEIPAQCPVCKAPASAFVEKKGNTYVTEHVVGIGKAEGVPQEIVDGLRANFEGECSEVGMYLAMARVAEREGYPEIAEAYPGPSLIIAYAPCINDQLAKEKSKYILLITVFFVILQPSMTTPRRT